MSADSLRVVIAEDMVLLRAGVARLLTDEGIDVVAETGDPEGLVDAVGAWSPDVAIVDIKMPPTHTDEGLRAAVQIRREHPGTAVLLLSSYLDARYATELLQASPSSCGYLLKDRVADAAMLVEALHRVVKGECVLDPEVVATVLRRARTRNAVEELTERERHILGLMAEGHSNAAICGQLTLSKRTVESHIRRIFLKLDLAETTDTSRRVLAVLRYLRG